MHLKLLLWRIVLTSAGRRSPCLFISRSRPSFFVRSHPACSRPPPCQQLFDSWTRTGERKVKFPWLFPVIMSRYVRAAGAGSRERNCCPALSYRWASSLCPRAAAAKTSLWWILKYKAVSFWKCLQFVHSVKLLGLLRIVCCFFFSLFEWTRADKWSTLFCD